MDRRRFARMGAVGSVLVLLAGCSPSDEKSETPGLEARGTVLTTVQPTKQDLTNQISLAGKVAINPLFGIVAPVDGELRYLDRRPSTTPATRPIWVATVWDDGVPRRIEVPKDAMFAGRLMEDRAEVTAGMPVVSARHGGYGIVADIDSAQAYRISGSVKNVRAQIKNGPGPFSCTALGTIAALPAGTVPEPPPEPTPTPQGSAAPPVVEQQPEETAPGSEATGMQLVCAAPDDVQLINGASVTLDVITARARKVLTLPVEAVAGVQGKGKVDVVDENRNRKTVDVVLGLTDGKVVQIKSGLRGDETIAVPGPDLPTPPPGPEGPVG
ncbi:MAG: efflux RND transporter periplasmic adaptor subunit [Actinoplanes sp.]